MRLIARSFALGAFLLWVAVAAFAQGRTDTQTAESWDALVTRTQNAIDRNLISDDVFVTLRDDIARYRSTFDQDRSANTARIALLREQIAALGPEPSGDGATPETAEAAAERLKLNTELAALTRPVQRAEAAFVLADGLIAQVDQTLRERQTEELLRVNKTPLNPQLWEPAVKDLRAAIRSVWTERAARRAATDWRDLNNNLVGVVAFGLLGMVLILRGRRWARNGTTYLQGFGWRGFGIWRFVVSLLRVILPLLGLLALVTSVRLTGYFGVRGDEVLARIPMLGGMMLGFRWLSERIFSRDDEEAQILLTQKQRSKARRFVVLLTVTIVIEVILAVVLEAHSASEASIVVIGMPTFVLSAYALFRLGRLMAQYYDAAGPEDRAELRNPTFRRIVRVLGQGAVIVAVVSPILMFVGYKNLAAAILPPYVVSLALLGLVMVLQRFLTDLYGAISGKGAQARDALLPVLLGFGLLLLAAPAMALIWGARVTDLTELWAGFKRGFVIGETRVSPTDFLTFAVIFVVGYALTRLIQSTLRSNVLPKTQIDIGGQNAIVSGLGYVGIILASILAVTGAGIDLTSLAFVAGALSLGIGFGLQNIVSNFVSGVILLIERPISEGDWIQVGDQMGYVRDISVRSTRIETFDRTDVIVPNADLVSGTVTNYTRGNTVGRVIVPIGVAYGTDTRLVEGILREIAEAQPMVLADPKPAVLFVNFGADALEFEVRCFLRDVNWMMVVKNDINHAIAARFSAEGIEIPFAQRDMWLRNPEALALKDKPA